MAKGHRMIRDTPGMTFYKMMGSGSGLGFNFYPDWSVYLLLQIWESEEAANKFQQNSPLIQAYQQHCEEVLTIFMRSIKSHGNWSGSNPFHISCQLDPNIDHIAVITRATIRTSALIKFWRYVPKSQRPIEQNLPGLIYTKGIGEVPIKQMATFSIWKDTDSLKSFAYGSQEHRQAIKMTRDLNWYSEELFARFQPYKTIGKWEAFSLPF